MTASAQRRVDDDAAVTMISESDVLARWPALSLALLRRARKQGQISWIPGKRHSAWYRADAVEQFIANYVEQPCRAVAKLPSSNSADSGSPSIPDRHSSTVSGLSQDLEEHAALHFARQI